MSFYQQLLLTIADKLVIGLIILIIGLWLNRKLERFKSDLNRLAKEHEVRFSELHKKRAGIIAELFSLLYKADISVRVIEIRTKEKHSEATLEYAAKEAKEACNKALEFYERNKLYLSKELSDLIFRSLSTMHLTSSASPFPETRSGALDIWTEESHRIALIMDRLEQEFRIMLGSEIGDNASFKKSR
jgi:hypothetical protein